MPPTALFKVVNAVHRPLFRLSKGRIGGRGQGMPVLVLTTTGRKTGAKRSNMLTSPLRLGDSIVLVASRGGDDRNPDWFFNLQADPAVEVEMDGVSRPMTARVADATQKAELWPQIVAEHTQYADYQRKTGRDIPVIVLDPTVLTDRPHAGSARVARGAGPRDLTLRAGGCEDGTVHAAAVCFDIHIPASRSLKAKRAAIRPIVDGLRHRFHVSVAEVDHQDQWQRSAIGVAAVSGTAGHLRDVLDSVERFVDHAPDVEVLDVETTFMESE